MTPTTAELREAAILLHDYFAADTGAIKYSMEEYSENEHPWLRLDRQAERWAACEIAQLLLSHFPADGQEPITADWLREEWGFYDVDVDTMEHQNIGGSVVFDKGYWQWWYPHDCYVVFKDRHHASSLFVALGIEPKRKESND